MEQDLDFEDRRAHMYSTKEQESQGGRSDKMSPCHKLIDGLTISQGWGSYPENWNGIPVLCTHRHAYLLTDSIGK